MRKSCMRSETATGSAGQFEFAPVKLLAVTRKHGDDLVRGRRRRLCPFLEPHKSGCCPFFRSWRPRHASGCRRGNLLVSSRVIRNFVVQILFTYLLVSMHAVREQV